MQGWENVRTLFNDTIDLIVLSLFVLIGLIGLQPGMQRSWSYAAAGLVLGTMLGLASRRFGLPAGVDIIMIILGVACGPFTITKLQGKSIMDAIDEIISVRDRIRHGDDDDAS